MVFDACVRSAMLHGSKTWAPNANDLQRLRRNDRSVIRWICGAKLRDEIPPSVLHDKLGVEEIASVLRCRRLRWYGHADRATASGIHTVQEMSMPRGPGRPKKTWLECLKDDKKQCNLSGFLTHDRVAWREAVRYIRLQPTPDSGTPAAV